MGPLRVPSGGKDENVLERLWHSFQDGGWVMYWIFAFGLTGVASAGRFAWRGEHQLLGFIRWMAVTVLLSGCFGFVVGSQLMLAAATSPPASDLEARANILLHGTREALSCVSGALMFTVIICLLAAIGQRRFPLPNPGSVAR
jgi:hypothetical protein